MDQPNLSEAMQLLINIAQQADGPEIVPISFKHNGQEAEVPVAFVADGPGKVKPVSLLPLISEAHARLESLRTDGMPGPDHRKGTASHQTLESFVAHVNRFRDDDSAVWAHRNGQQTQLVAIFDYHAHGATGTPRWGRHRAVYPCPLSDAWKQWGGGSKLLLDQEDLAEFLEAHDYELANGTLPSGTTAPQPAFLLTMANRLETYSTATAKRERDPNTGRTKISYNEEKGVAGDVVPPPAFLISIPVFVDSEPRAMEVRLSVKVESGAATFTLWIHNAEKHYREAMETIRTTVTGKTALPVFDGTPE